MNGDAMSGFASNKSMRIAAVFVLGFLALFLMVQTIGTAKGLGRSPYPANELITVSGEGQAALAPDVARITLSVQNNATTVADAQAASTKQANAAVEYLKGQGIDEKDIKTTSYNINPRYSYPRPCPAGSLCPEYYEGSPKVTGYEVTQSIQVTVRDLTKVGALLGGVGTLGVQNVSGPAFALDDPTAGYSAARADAISKAKAEARELAKQLGVSLGKIVNYSDNQGGYPYPSRAEFGMGGDVATTKAATPEVPVGENTYHASVSITYEIR